MDAIIGFFQGIGQAIAAAFDFVISFFADLVYLVKVTGKILVSIPGYFTWVPASIWAILFTALTILVLYKILGRE